MNQKHVILGAYWKDRRITAKEFIKLCRAFLARLREFSSAFAHRCVAVGEKPNIIPVTVPLDYGSFESLMLKAVRKSDDAYTNPDPENKDPTLDSTIETGFSVVFSDEGQQGIPPTVLAVFVAAGAHGSRLSPSNHVIIEIPPEYRELYENRQRAKELMKLLVTAWQPSFATLTSRELRKALDAERRNNITLGVVTYFNDKTAGDIAKECAVVDALPTGGTLLSIDVPSPWAASVDRFKACYIRLNNAGLLQIAA